MEANTAQITTVQWAACNEVHFIAFIQWTDYTQPTADSMM